jgi:hypothetical protein
MPKQSQQDDDRQRNAEKPKQCATSESHVTLLQTRPRSTLLIKPSLLFVVPQHIKNYLQDTKKTAAEAAVFT